MRRLGAEGAGTNGTDQEEIAPFLQVARAEINEVEELYPGAAIAIKDGHPVPDFTNPPFHARDTGARDHLRRQLAEARLDQARQSNLRDIGQRAFTNISI